MPVCVGVAVLVGLHVPDGVSVGLGVAEAVQAAAGTHVPVAVPV